MILSWNKAEMAPSVDVLDCTKLAINFCDKQGRYLGPISWFNADTGDYVLRVRDLEGEPVVVHDRFVYEEHEIDTQDVRVFLRAENGDNLVEVSLEYVKGLAAMMRDSLLDNTGSSRLAGCRFGRNGLVPG